MLTVPNRVIARNCLVVIHRILISLSSKAMFLCLVFHKNRPRRQKNNYKLVPNWGGGGGGGGNNLTKTHYYKPHFDFLGVKMGFNGTKNPNYFYDRC